MKNHICRDCRFYNVLYSKCTCKFEKLNKGICLQSREIVQKNCRCELYKYRIQKEKVVTIEYIDNVIEDIKELEKIFNSKEY